jgi:hypothetical protein
LRALLVGLHSGLTRLGRFNQRLRVLGISSGAFFPHLLLLLRGSLEHDGQIRRLFDLKLVAPDGVVDRLGATIASAAPNRLFSTMAPGITVWILSNTRNGRGVPSN